MKMYLDLNQGLMLAKKIKAELAPACSKIEIAGSIRRKANQVGDIEIVCIPIGTACQQSLFGNDSVMAHPTDLDIKLKQLVNAGRLCVPTKCGPKYKSYPLVYPEGFNLDIFITTPNSWGYQLAIRTGNAWFSKKIVTQLRYRGFLPDAMFTENGGLWLKKGTALPKYIPTPTEQDFFNYLTCGWLEPEHRNEQYLKRAMII